MSDFSLTKDKVSKVLRLVSNRMKSIQNTQINETCKIGIIDIQNWEWAQAVGLCSLFRFYEQSGDQNELAWIEEWINNNLDKGLPAKNINTTAPLYTVIQVAELTKNDTYLTICREWANNLLNEFPRTKFGGFQHIATGETNEQQLWDDTLFMAVLFLAKMGVAENNKEYLNECEHQFLLHAKYLADISSGLWYHGWTFEGNHNFAKAKWGRGNCWITAFIPDFLEITGLDCGCRQIMIDTLLDQVEALKKYQAESGMWHTLIDDPGSYEETSATAGFAYGILKSIRLGILDSNYLDIALKAAYAVIQQVDKEGTVQNVSYGTGMGKTLQDYRDIPICPMAYGQALAVLLFAELLQHID